MNNFKFYLRTVFGFSAREVNGFLVMASMMLVFLMIPPLTDILVRPEIPTQRPAEIFSSNTSEQPGLFSFNPNTATSEDFQKLGLNTFIATRIEKFRIKGGYFKQRTDLMKIYGMDSAWYERVKDSIQIPQTQHTVHTTAPRTFSEFRKPITEKSTTPLLDINRCDSTQLESLRGIGPTLASRIVRYRQKLGGFIDTSQFKEVYGLKEFSLEELKRSCLIDPNFIPTKIPINTATATELGPHPYIGWKAANILVRWRTQHGPIPDIEKLKEIRALEHLDRLLPYVQF